jgi:hypothetical protein
MLKTVKFQYYECDSDIYPWYTHLQHNQACLHILETVCGPGTVVSLTASVSTVTDGHTSLTVGQPAIQRKIPVDVYRKYDVAESLSYFAFYLPGPCL